MCASLTTTTSSGTDAALGLAVLFDSPVKTQREIDFALRHGIPMNIDNWEELVRTVQYNSRTAEHAYIVARVVEHADSATAVQHSNRIVQRRTLPLAHSLATTTATVYCSRSLVLTW